MRQRRFKCNRKIIDGQFGFYARETMGLCGDLRGLEYSTRESFLTDMESVFGSLKSLRRCLGKCSGNQKAGVCFPETDCISVGSCYFEPCKDEIKKILKDIPVILRHHRTVCMGIRKEE